jgi:tRNA pseudouridine13 synthase
MWVEKRGVSTLDAVEALATELGQPAREFGFAGLKDARAVTRQWLSIHDVDPARAEKAECPGVRVLAASRHENKLRMGHLRGNRFGIVLRGVDPDHLEALQKNVDHLKEVGVPNYFGEQRFGKRGANLAKGLKILSGNPKKTARRIPKRLLRLLISAVQSEVFNRVLNRRIEDIDQLVDGDVAWIHESGACFLVDNAQAEAKRCKNFEISPSGPMPGPKMLRASGEVARLEDEILAELAVDCEVFGRVPGGTNSGVRRPLRVPLGSPKLSPLDSAARIEFELGKGSFATAVLRQLLTDLPWV